LKLTIVDTQTQCHTHVPHILLRALPELLTRLAALLEVRLVVTRLGARAAFFDTLLFALREAGEVVAECQPKVLGSTALSYVS